MSQIRVSQIRASQIRVSQIRAGQIRASQTRASQIRASQIRASQIRASEISSNHRELHGAIFCLCENVVGRLGGSKMFWNVPYLTVWCPFRRRSNQPKRATGLNNWNLSERNNGTITSNHRETREPIFFFAQSTCWLQQNNLCRVLVLPETGKSFREFELLHKRNVKTTGPRHLNLDHKFTLRWVGEVSTSWNG